jgi:hypothetical protein
MHAVGESVCVALGVIQRESRITRAPAPLVSIRNMHIGMENRSFGSFRQFFL